MKRISSNRPKIVPQGYTIGRRGFAKISAVEGIHITDEMAEEFRQFDRDNLSPDDRRRRLNEKYAKTR